MTVGLPVVVGVCVGVLGTVKEGREYFTSVVKVTEKRKAVI